MWHTTTQNCPQPTLMSVWSRNEQIMPMQVETYARSEAELAGIWCFSSPTFRLERHSFHHIKSSLLNVTYRNANCLQSTLNSLDACLVLGKTNHANASEKKFLIRSRTGWYLVLCFTNIQTGAAQRSSHQELAIECGIQQHKTALNQP